MRTTGMRGWLAMVAMAAAAAVAGEGMPQVVCNVKVVSGEVPDVTTLEDWRRSHIKEGMTNDEKAVAIWQTVVKYRHQCPPPKEFVQHEGCVHDVMKTIHVYGYGQCCCASANVAQLARFLGWDARGWAITLHSVPEVFYDGTWHMLDASVMNFFRNPDGSIAGVADIAKAVKEWHDANPGYRGDDAKLRKFARGGNWRKAGPALLTTTDTYSEDGPNAAGWHGWSSTMIEYDRADKHHVYEYGYSQGYRPNIQLRPGERLTRNWFNKGLHINMDGSGGNPGGILKGRAELGLQKKLGDIAPGRIGNGTLDYDVPLAPDAFAAGPLVIRMPSPYVYLGGEAAFKAIVGPGGAITASVSDNNGRDWKEIGKVLASGTQRLDLRPHIYRRYDYRLRLELSGEGTRLDSLKLTHDIQHAQTPLPALAQGENTIAFSAGPHEGTITIEGATNPDVKPKQLIAADFHPEFRGVDQKLFRVKEYGPDGGSITFPIETPGDIVRLRAGAHYRARDKREGWTIQASFDDGKTWAELGKLPGPTPGATRHFALENVPKGTRKALVRYQSARQYNTLCIFDFRIDADYAEPAGGFRPVKITYLWDEEGVEKRHVHVAEKPNDAYKITCAAPPLMKSIILELAD